MPIALQKHLIKNGIASFIMLIVLLVSLFNNQDTSILIVILIALAVPLYLFTKAYFAYQSHNVQIINAKCINKTKDHLSNMMQLSTNTYAYTFEYCQNQITKTFSLSRSGTFFGTYTVGAIYQVAYYNNGMDLSSSNYIDSVVVDDSQISENKEVNPSENQ